MRALNELLTMKDVMAQTGLSITKVMKAIKSGDLHYAYRGYNGVYYFEHGMVADFVEKRKIIEDLISRTKAKAILGVSADYKFDSMNIQPASETSCGYKLYSKKELEDFMERTFGIRSAEDIRANYYSLKEVSYIFNESVGYLRHLLYSGDIVADLQLLSHQYYFSRVNVEGIGETIGKIPNWEAAPEKGLGVA